MIIQFPNRDPRPIIGIGEYDYYERHAIQKQIVDLLLATGEIFKHDHRLVRIVQYTDSGGAYTRLERVNAVWLLAMVSELARFRKIDGRSGPQHVHARIDEIPLIGQVAVRGIAGKIGAG